MTEKIEAITTNGGQVILKLNGRWEYVDAKKVAEASKIASNILRIMFVRLKHKEAGLGPSVSYLAIKILIVNPEVASKASAHS